MWIVRGPDTYHTDGAADRLKAAAEKYSLKGYTHYLRGDDDGSWFFSEEGDRFFHTTSEMGLIASIAMGSHQHEALRKVATEFPSIPFLCHHMGGATGRRGTPVSTTQAGTRLGKCSEYSHQNVRFCYVSQVSWDYPHSDTHWIVRALYEHFGSRTSLLGIRLSSCSQIYDVPTRA